MTNTKFRKRALLSAVAMLLVALVALGSATFAWFTTNPTATASGLQVHTSTGAGLVALTETERTAGRSLFSHDAKLFVDTYTAASGADPEAYTFKASQDIQPASFDPEIVSAAGELTFKKATAAATDAYAKNASAFAAGAAYTEKVFLKTTDNTAAANTIKLGTVKVDIDETNDKLAGCVRVAVTTSNGKLIGVWQANGADKGTRSAFTYYSENASATDNIFSGYTFKADGDTVTIAAADQLTVTNSTTANYATVYVYLDGEDENCTSDDVANAAELLGTDGIVVTFTAAD